MKPCSQTEINQVLFEVMSSGRCLPPDVLFDFNYTGGEADVIDILIGHQANAQRFNILLSQDRAIEQLLRLNSTINHYKRKKHDAVKRLP